MKFSGVFCLALVLCAGCNVDNVPNQPYLTARQEYAFLLASDAIGIEIHATAEQERQWHDSFEWYQTEVNPNFLSIRQAASTEEMERDQAFAERVLTYATPGQQGWLLQLGLQKLGLDAFSKEDVQAELHFTDYQASQANECLAEYRAKQHIYEQDLDDYLAKYDQRWDRPEFRREKKEYEEQGERLFSNRSAQLEQDLKNARNLIVGAMTPDQATHWMKMLGAPYEFSGSNPDETFHASESLP